jgi:hypothetical protein
MMGWDKQFIVKRLVSKYSLKSCSILSFENKLQKEPLYDIYRMSRASVYPALSYGKTEGLSAQTASCTVSFGNEQ